MHNKLGRPTAAVHVLRIKQRKNVNEQLFVPLDILRDGLMGGRAVALIFGVDRGGVKSTALASFDNQVFAQSVRTEFDQELAPLDQARLRYFQLSLFGELRHLARSLGGALLA